MSNLFFYEPFYDIDRLVEHTFNISPQGVQNQRGDRDLVQRTDRSVDGAIRSFKPR